MQEKRAKTEPPNIWLRMLPWVACFGALLVQFQGIIFSGMRQMHGGLGDGRLVNFTLEHGYRWLLQIPPHEDFWRAPIYHPYPTASAFTDTMLGFGPPYWLARALGAAPDTALQWWMLCIHTLNFFVAYLLLRKGPRLDILASTAGALLMAIISARWISHLQLFPYVYSLLALLALFRIFDTDHTAPNSSVRRMWIVIFCACFVLQVWAAIYAFFFFGLLTATGLILVLSLPKVRPAFVGLIRRDIGVWLLTAGLSLAAISPLVVRYSATADELGYRDYHSGSIARPYSWIITGQQDRIFGYLFQPGGPLPKKPEALGVGLLTFCVAAGGLLAYRRRQSVKLLAVATLTLMALSTIYGSFSPWEYIHKYVPGANGIRAQWRITMILIPAAVLGVAMACQYALNRRLWWLALLLISTCIVERFHLRSTIDKYYIREHIAQIVQQVDPQYKAFLLVGEGRKDKWISEDAAWVTMATGRPTVNGRYGNTPSSYDLHYFDVSRRGGDFIFRNEQARKRLLAESLEQWLDVWGLDRSEVQWIEFESLTAKDTKPYRSKP